MAHFICYAHFQGNNPPWPADFGSTPWMSVIRMYTGPDPIPLIYIAQPSTWLHSPTMSALLRCYTLIFLRLMLKSTSTRYVVINGGCCGYMASWPVLPAFLVIQLWMLKSPVHNMVRVSPPTSPSYPPWCRLLPQFIRNHRHPSIESQSRSKYIGM